MASSQKKALRILAILSILLPFCRGCTPTPLSIAEKADSAALEVINTVWQIDDENRAIMREKFPELHAIIEQSRKDVPSAFRLLRAAEDAYRSNPTPENSATLDIRLQQVSDLARLARQTLARMEAANLKKTGKPTTRGS